jgi:hypothetical protein
MHVYRILVCIVCKTLTIFVFVFFSPKKYFATCHGDTWHTYGHMSLEHVATWLRVKNSRGHTDTCNKYMCPDCQPDRHVYKSTW